MSAEFLRDILRLFNSGEMDAATACERLQIGRTQLHRLRTAWLADRKAFLPKASGGNHKETWPKEVESFLREILPLSRPLNHAFLADQLSRRFAFIRSRSAVAQHVQQQIKQPK